MMFKIGIILFFSVISVIIIIFLSLVAIWNSIFPTTGITTTFNISSPDSLIYCDKRDRGICLKVENYKILESKIFSNKEQV